MRTVISKFNPVDKSKGNRAYVRSITEAPALGKTAVYCAGYDSTLRATLDGGKSFAVVRAHEGGVGCIFASPVAPHDIATVGADGYCRGYVLLSSEELHLLWEFKLPVQNGLINSEMVCWSPREYFASSGVIDGNDITVA